MTDSFTPSIDTPADVAIIGGGIAGSSCAIVLRRAGLDVVLVERQANFRDRIRGEAVHPWGVREIEALGLRPLLDAAGALPLPKWTKYRDGIPGEPYAWSEDFPDSPGGVSVNHVDLQDTLLAGALREGVRIYRPATATPTLTGDHWTIDIDVEGQSHRLSARLLIGADGQRSATRRLVGGKVTRDPVHHQMGGMLVRGVDLPPDSAHQAFHNAGFAMVYLQSGDLARVYYVCPEDEASSLRGAGNEEAFLARVAALFPAGAFIRAEPAGPLGFFPNADLVSDRIAGARALMIGDAAGANDPSLGHGLALVFRDVRVVRDLVAALPLEEVPARFSQEREAYFAVLRAHAQWMAPLVAGTGEEVDALRAQVARAREVDPGTGGFAALFPLGPDGLSIDEDARAHFYGEDLPDATVFGYPRHRLRGQ